MTDEAAPARPRLPGVTRPRRSNPPQGPARAPRRPRLALAFVAIAALFAIGGIVQAPALWVFVPFALLASVIFALGGTESPIEPQENSLFHRLHTHPEMVPGTLQYDQFRGFDYLSSSRQD
ncbi:hypothetical protein [Methylobacterium sp.]|uniref:hypothetical protein n=1 Tax=Methylobacterium sp. TaxID=409 RepID=UPI003C75AF99